MRTGRPTACHYCPSWVTGVWLSLGILTLLLTGGCKPSVAPLDVRPPDAQIIDDAGRSHQVPRPIRVSRPRGPAYRLDNGLGSPIT